MSCWLADNTPGFDFKVSKNFKTHVFDLRNFMAVFLSLYTFVDPFHYKPLFLSLVLYGNIGYVVGAGKITARDLKNISENLLLNN